ncbi:MAG: hypothetical protein FJ288_12305 [Planctomycetes bacterium]|nr:hypothetical protein [Planctomycetota bacterium]
MRTVLTIPAAAAMVLALGGCWPMSLRDAAPAPAAPAPAATPAPYLQKAGVARETEPPLPTAVESTLLLQNKYARVLEDLSREQQRSRDVAEQNQKLADQAARLQADLARAQQELTEANNLLIQMRQELDKWKADVLGFRDESRKVHEAELEALGKIMTLLGGEPPKVAQAPGDPGAGTPEKAAAERPPAATPGTGRPSEAKAPPGPAPAPGAGPSAPASPPKAAPGKAVSSAAGTRAPAAATATAAAPTPPAKDLTHEP